MRSLIKVNSCPGFGFLSCFHDFSMLIFGRSGIGCSPRIRSLDKGVPEDGKNRRYGRSCIARVPKKRGATPSH